METADIPNMMDFRPENFISHATSIPHSNPNMAANSSTNMNPNAHALMAAHLAQVTRPSLSDTATREERKALAARHRATSSLSGLSASGSPAPTTTAPSSTTGVAPTPDGSTEEDDLSPASQAVGLTNVLYPPAETVQGAALLIHGIKRKGAKSRVETQIKMRISLVQRFDMGNGSQGGFLHAGNNGMMDLLTPPISLLSDSPSHDTSTTAPTQATPSFARIGTFRAIRLQPGLGVKRRAKKSQEIDAALSLLPPTSVLSLETEVWCTDNPGRRAWACLKCVMRERKRAMSKSSAGPGGGRRAAGKARKVEEEDDSAHDSRSLQSERNLPVDSEGLTEEDRNRIVLFNCGNLVELVQGECELPMRVTCYCRHHKEKTGFRIVMNLRDINGRIVARGETPTIMITDDHKTSGTSRISTAGTGTGTDTGIMSAASGRSGVSSGILGTAGGLPSRPRTKKPREPSASTEDERRAAPGIATSSSAGLGGKHSKGKPYDRPSVPTTLTGGTGADGIIASPRTSGFTTHGLSMTPLNGRSIPGSPAAGPSGTGSYFTLPGQGGILPGSGAVSPSLLMGGQGQAQGNVNGKVYDAQQRESVPSSPQQQGISDALPAISQRLSDWAAESGRQGWRIHQHHQMGFPQPPMAQQFYPQQQSQQQQQPQHRQSQQHQQHFQTAPQPTGLALNLPAIQGEPLMQSMVAEDDPSWAYASSEGGLSQHGGQGSSVFSQDTGSFAFTSPRSSLHGHDNYGYHSATGSVTGASDISDMHFTEPEPDFESMLNLSPQDSPVDLPMDDGTSPVSNLSNPDSYQSLGWSPQPVPNPTAQSLLQPPQFDTAASSRPPNGPPRPKITRLVPMEGPTHGGIEVTVLGENFYPGMVCAFGAFNALTVQTYGPTTIVCVLPPSPNPGAVPVHVLEPNGQPQPWDQPPICFTYQDATDRKLMEMALTAVGLRVTGKVVGAVEIARRIMSAPGAGHEGADMSQAQQQNMNYQRADMSHQEQELADELAKTVYSTTSDTQSAILKFLSAFVTGHGGEHGSRRRRQSQAALNHVNSEGQTLLQLASLLGYDRVVQLLLRANATIDIHDRNGYSALAFAAVAGSVPCVKFLLEAGAKVGAYTFTNQTAHSLALQAGHRGVAKLLSRPTVVKPVKKPRRSAVRSAGESLDADNPSSADTDSIQSEGLLGPADALSPSRLTTAKDIAAVQNARPAIPVRSSVEAKSDGTVTPRAGRGSGLPGTLESDDPPPYAAVDAISWLQRTLSHIPGAQMIPPTPQLRDFIPPVVWDKLPSAQLLIPHLPNLPSPTSFRPGDIMEQQWASQAWLAVPIQAWMNALPKVPQMEGTFAGMMGSQAEEPSATGVPLTTVRETVTPSVRRYKTPTREHTEGHVTTVKTRRGPAASKRKGKSENARYLPGEGDEQLQRDKKRRSFSLMLSPDPLRDTKGCPLYSADRMLFLFWLPVLAMAFCYTIITAVPYAVGRAILAPVMRAFT
ncbi:hypothetical protein QFC21_005844 [Naganishia friedmannii]|uniref:Uncharacterized protein n=1 Tax=Naganishia friedmannii TaxID=89922 RepID=A0ACC2V5Y7_9TREE|nr:hypothetical protein QFC21_005844 [Naganishia friedmannii]